MLQLQLRRKYRLFLSMFRELSAYEAELDYRDENVTELELKYAEYKAIAEKMRAVYQMGREAGLEKLEAIQKFLK